MSLMTAQPGGWDIAGTSQKGPKRAKRRKWLYKSNEAYQHNKNSLNTNLCCVFNIYLTSLMTVQPGGWDIAGTSQKGPNIITYWCRSAHQPASTPLATFTTALIFPCTSGMVLFELVHPTGILFIQYGNLNYASLDRSTLWLGTNYGPPPTSFYQTQSRLWK